MTSFTNLSTPYNNIYRFHISFLSFFILISSFSYCFTALRLSPLSYLACCLSLFCFLSSLKLNCTLLFQNGLTTLFYSSILFSIALIFGSTVSSLFFSITYSIIKSFFYYDVEQFDYSYCCCCCFFLNEFKISNSVTFCWF